jgi:hypothetical protein
VGIFVEILVRAPMEQLWAHSQRPELHERWDLRFSQIEYLPKASAAEPQRFRYTTRIGLGLDISGEGESVGETDLADGSRSSSLKFSSNDPRSIIREGSGYGSAASLAREGDRAIAGDAADDRSRGSFDIEWRTVDAEVPSHILPARQERRE